MSWTKAIRITEHNGKDVLSGGCTCGSFSVSRPCLRGGGNHATLVASDSVLLAMLKLQKLLLACPTCSKVLFGLEEVAGKGISTLVEPPRP